MSVLVGGNVIKVGVSQKRARVSSPPFHNRSASHFSSRSTVQIVLDSTIPGRMIFAAAVSSCALKTTVKWFLKKLLRVLCPFLPYRKRCYTFPLPIKGRQS